MTETISIVNSFHSFHHISSTKFRLNFLEEKRAYKMQLTNWNLLWWYFHFLDFCKCSIFFLNYCLSFLIAESSWNFDSKVQYFICLPQTICQGIHRYCTNFFFKHGHQMSMSLLLICFLHRTWLGKMEQRSTAFGRYIRAKSVLMTKKRKSKFLEMIKFTTV